MCSLVIVRYLWFFFLSTQVKILKEKKKTNLTPLCCVPQTAYLFDAWLILTFALKLSVIVCVRCMHFCFVTRIEGKWILTFTSVFHFRSIKYATGVTERCMVVQKKRTMLNGLARLTTELMVLLSKVSQVMAMEYP